MGEKAIKYCDLFKLSHECEITVDGVDGNFVGVSFCGNALWYKLDDLKVSKIKKRAKITVLDYDAEMTRFNKMVSKSK